MLNGKTRQVAESGYGDGTARARWLVSSPYSYRKNIHAMIHNFCAEGSIERPHRTVSPDVSNEFTLHAWGPIRALKGRGGITARRQ